MTDAVKALGQDVQHKAADELVRRQPNLDIVPPLWSAYKSDAGSIPS
jgi:hypothetical protein